MFIKLYAIALPVFAIDMIWLGVVAKDFYRAQIGHLMKSDTNLDRGGYLLTVSLSPV